MNVQRKDPRKDPRNNQKKDKHSDSKKDQNQRRNLENDKQTDSKKHQKQSDSKREDVKNGIIFVRTNSHNLFCSVYGVEYDRVGIVSGDNIWLYWTIPTCLSHFVGTLSEFEFSGGIIMFGRILEKIDPKIIEKSVKNIKSDEKNYEKVLRKFITDLGSKSSEKQIFDAIYDVIALPILFYKDDKVENIICTDLMLKIASNPDSILESRNKHIKNMIKKLINEAESLIYKIENDRKVTLNSMKNFINAINEAKKTVMMDLTPRTENNLKSKTDKLILIEIDKSIRRNLKEIAKSFVGLETGTLQLMPLLKLTNQLLGYFDLQLNIVPDTLPYSCLIIADENSAKSFRANSEIVIPLSGQGIELLEKNDALELLKMIKNIQVNDDRFSVIKKRVTEMYYTGHVKEESINKNKNEGENGEQEYKNENKNENLDQDGAT